MLFRVGTLLSSSRATGEGGSSSLAATLLGAETSGWAADFTDMSLVVRDTTTPANNYTGTPGAWLTYTSPSTKWIVGQDGLLASGTTIRCEYSGATALGVRIEEARTNLCLWSDDLTNAVWTATNATTAKTATGPDGVANSATTVTATAGNATVLQSITSASAARFTDCYIKRRTGSGTIEVTQNGGTLWTAVTVTSSWTRVSIASATVTNPQVGLRIVTSGDAVDVAFFNCQSGATQTSPIRTTSATVTRAADAIGKVLSAFPDMTTGTQMIEFSKPALSVGANWIGFQGAGGLLGNRLENATAYLDYRNNAGTIRYLLAATFGAIAINTVYRHATTWANASFNQSINGVNGPEQLSGANDYVLTSANWGLNGNGATVGATHIKRVLLVPRRYTNPQLQTLTT